ncbi:helix-turn-helix domain-containing protein [Chitinophaga nivalis]|uniref:AraC family transcriptional regulator n=1 Tax=Chitinophaga nivalis TaxID=2991709 RepID=A0ABT3IN91_9BACT|nr:AraC family transcriptional regulator [Chitinophaga nivalis]MCW3464892.1 AraC family transcriptional regulator [Chitinophaga nivalis]MCW3485417.1 AraC family transcriptional regulator [Chitinophaga nivalis]
MKRKNIPVNQMDKQLSGFQIRQLQEFQQTVEQPSDGEHRDDHYVFVLVTHGKLDLFVDFREISLSARTLLLLLPGQIHKVLSYHKSQGYVISFDHLLVKEHCSNMLEQLSDESLEIKLKKEEEDTLTNFCLSLFQAFGNEKAIPFTQQVLHALLEAFIYRAMGIYTQRATAGIQHPARAVQLVRAFKKLVRQHFKTIKRPSQYASMLNISPSYLNDTVKNLTGHTLTFWIKQESILEARRLLYYTNLSIKEIAGTLAFDDPKYFLRLFRQATGQTPGAFRSKMTGK